jgi:hypothetical protein
MYQFDAIHKTGLKLEVREKWRFAGTLRSPAAQYVEILRILRSELDLSDLHELRQEFIPPNHYGDESRLKR